MSLFLHVHFVYVMVSLAEGVCVLRMAPAQSTSGMVKREDRGPDFIENHMLPMMGASLGNPKTYYQRVY